MSDEKQNYSEGISSAVQNITAGLKYWDDKISKVLVSEESIKNIQSVLTGIQSAVQSIDFEAIHAFYEGLNQFEKQIIDFSHSMSENEVYLDMDYYGDLYMDEYEEYMNEQKVSEWMEHSIGKTVSKINELDYMQRHKTTLNQTYKAYMNGDFTLAIMGVYPILEYFVSNWKESQGNGGKFMHESPTKKQLKKHEVKEIAGDYFRETEKHEDIERFFQMKALEGFYNMFHFKGNSRLNRNSILHGSHDYDELKSEDYLKLVYLLNTLTGLHGVVLNE